MRAGRIQLICGICGTGLLLQACATSWVTRTPHEDDRYRYYVGRSYSAASQDQGLEAARADAKIRAIEENFGAQVKFQRDTNETIDAAQVIERSREISKSVHLEGFEELEVKQEEIDDDVWNTAVLCRYSKAAIKAEQARLEKEPTKEDAITFDSVDTTPTKTETLPDHRSVQSTFAFGLGLGGSSATMKDVDNSTLNFRLLGEMRLSHYVGLDAFAEFGGKSDGYTNGALNISKSVYGLGLPIYFFSVDRSAWTPFIEPTLQAVRTGLSFSNTSGNTTSSVSKWQLGPGANIGTQIRLWSGDQGGFSIRPQVGVYQPVMNSGVTGTPAIQGGLLFQWELFKK